MNYLILTIMIIIEPFFPTQQWLGGKSHYFITPHYKHNYKHTFQVPGHKDDCPLMESDFVECPMPLDMDDQVPAINVDNKKIQHGWESVKIPANRLKE